MGKNKHKQKSNNIANAPKQVPTNTTSAVSNKPPTLDTKSNNTATASNQKKTPLRSRNQVYAESAHNKIKKLDSELKKEYKSRADGFAVIVLQSGLAQALGFLRAKANGTDTINRAYEQYRIDLASLVAGIAADAFHEKVITTDLATYRIYTRQTLEAATAIKRMAQALISSDKLSGKNDSTSS